MRAFFLVLCLLPHLALAADYRGKKIFYLDSYHSGYEWSDGTEAGIRRILEPTGVELEVFYLDSRRQPADAAVGQAALRAKAAIEAFRPDVLIAADDNASKFVVMPYYREAALPVVFCGLNWDASLYGYPYRNATGMVEVDLVELLVKHLRTYSRGGRVGTLAVDQSTERKMLEYHRAILGAEYQYSAYVKTFAEWKKQFLALQDQVDILLLFNTVGIAEWDRAEALRFVQENTRIPSGAIVSWQAPFALASLTKLPEEQGEWAAETALRILGGESPASIPLAQNKQGKLVLNLDLALKLSLTLDPRLYKRAKLIRCPPEAAECRAVEPDTSP
jgi:hypothetical protein